MGFEGDTNIQSVVGAYTYTHTLALLQAPLTFPGCRPLANAHPSDREAPPVPSLWDTPAYFLIPPPTRPSPVPPQGMSLPLLFSQSILSRSLFLFDLGNWSDPCACPLPVAFCGKDRALFIFDATAPHRMPLIWWVLKI